MGLARQSKTPDPFWLVEVAEGEYLDVQAIGQLFDEGERRGERFIVVQLGDNERNLYGASAEAVVAHYQRWLAVSEEPVSSRLQHCERRALTIGPWRLWSLGPLDMKGIWIEAEDGEGGQFNEDVLSETIRQHYQRHF